MRKPIQIVISLWSWILLGKTSGVWKKCGVQRQPVARISYYLGIWDCIVNYSGDWFSLCWMPSEVVHAPSLMTEVDIDGGQTLGSRLGIVDTVMILWTIIAVITVRRGRGNTAGAGTQNLLEFRLCVWMWLMTVNHGKGRRMVVKPQDRLLFLGENHCRNHSLHY